MSETTDEQRLLFFLAEAPQATVLVADASDWQHGHYDVEVRAVSTAGDGLVVGHLQPDLADCVQHAWLDGFVVWPALWEVRRDESRPADRRHFLVLTLAMQDAERGAVRDREVARPARHLRARP